MLTLIFTNGERPCDLALANQPQPDPLTHYCIVRSDLPRGVQAAQLVHAAGESSPGTLTEGTYAVVLTVDSELQLEALHHQLNDRGIAHNLIRENDAPHAGQLMAIGVAPAPRSQLRRHFSSLPLLR